MATTTMGPGGGGRRRRAPARLTVAAAPPGSGRRILGVALPAVCFLAVALNVYIILRWHRLDPAAAAAAPGAPDSSPSSPDGRRRPAGTGGEGSRSKPPPIPLWELVNTEAEVACPPGMHLINDTVLGGASAASAPPRRIPRTVHMTGRTRCVPPEFAEVIRRWRFRGHDFYFHNDAALRRLLDRDWPEFPQLRQVLRCTKGGAGLADVWRALLMWEYGGIYSDIDNAPAKFDAAATLRAEDDAFFVVERSGHLSQYFFAARPRHPLFFLLVQHIVSRLLALNDVSLQTVALVTGPGATREAFCSFMGGQGPNYPVHKPAAACWYPTAGLYRGLSGYTVRAVGDKDNSDEYVARDVIPDKNLIYHRMNMTYFRDIPKVESKESCMQRIFKAEIADHAKESMHSQR